MTKRRARGQLDTFKHDVVDARFASARSTTCSSTCVIYGTPERVAEQIVELRQTVGPFGTLLYCGHDWADPRSRAVRWS